MTWCQAIDCLNYPSVFMYFINVTWKADTTNLDVQLIGTYTMWPLVLIQSDLIIAWSIRKIYLWKMLYSVWAHSCIELRSSAVMARSNRVRWNINDHRNTGRILIRCWIHERYSIPRANGWAMGCLLWIFWENWPHFNGTIFFSCAQQSHTYGITDMSLHPVLDQLNFQAMLCLCMKWLILCLHQTNERLHCNVTPSHIGWMQT